MIRAIDTWLADPDHAYGLSLAAIALLWYVLHFHAAPYLVWQAARRRTVQPTMPTGPLPRRTPRPVHTVPARHWPDDTTVRLPHLAEHYARVALARLLSSRPGHATHASVLGTGPNHARRRAS